MTGAISTSAQSCSSQRGQTDKRVPPENPSIMATAIRTRNKPSSVQCLDDPLITCVRLDQAAKGVRGVDVVRQAKELKPLVQDLHYSNKRRLTDLQLQHLDKFKASKQWAGKWKKRHVEDLKPIQLTEGGISMLEIKHESCYWDLEALLENDPEVWSFTRTMTRTRQTAIMDNEEAARMIAQGLRDSTNCNKLAVSCCPHVTEDTFDPIVAALQYNQGIRRLSLFQSHGAAKSVIEHLCELRHLTHLYLWCCDLGDDDAEHLALWLMDEQTCCEELILTQNKIGPKGANAIGLALSKNTGSTLTCLSMDANRVNSPLTDTRPTEFLRMVSTNKTLQRLHVDMNMMGDEACCALSKNKNSSFYDLMLGRNGITDLGAKYLAEFMEFNQQLCALGLRYNQMTEHGKNILADAILLWCSCHTIVSSHDEARPVFQLDIRDNAKTPKSLKQLQVAEENNVNLILDKFRTHARITPQVPAAPVSESFLSELVL